MESATTSTTYTGLAGREEGLMASTSEQDVRDFAAQFPTPNVKRAVALCEAGTLTWVEVAEIFRSSLAEGLEAVR